MKILPRSRSATAQSHHDQSFLNLRNSRLTCRFRRFKTGGYTVRCAAVNWMDGCVASCISSTMTPRRSRYVPAAESNVAHWLVTYDRYRRVIESTHLIVGTDLRVAILQLMAAYKADGWVVENDGAYGFLFCGRNGERREIRLQPTDPSAPVPLNNTAASGTPGT